MFSCKNKTYNFWQALASQILKYAFKNPAKDFSLFWGLQVAPCHCLGACPPSDKLWHHPGLPLSCQTISDKDEVIHV